MATISVILVDDHALIREALISMLSVESDIEVIGGAANGRDALGLVAERHPDVVVMDIGMKGLNGIEATRQILRDHPDVRVIALSSHSDRRYVMAMLDAGAHGYVLKESAGDELIRAIRHAYLNRKYLSPEVADVVVDLLTCGEKMEAPADRLGAREREVLQLLAEGHSSPSIAEQLHVSVGTIDAHRRNIMKKLDIHSVTELTKFAIREGLTSP